MILELVVAALVQQESVSYADVSRKHRLEAADALMREGKYLEAAVAYRNALLQTGDREAVRVPFALALFAHGDASYAGVELKRASTLYPDFAKLRIDPLDLFASRAELARLAEKCGREKTDGDGAETQAVLAYALHLAGEPELASAALGRYAQARGEDAFARTMKAVFGRVKEPAPGGERPPKRAEQMPARGEVARAGEPARAGTRFIEPAARPRSEIFEK